ncbi:MAG TPA: GNAT family N-acetyltransferase [Clostridium sp.]|nr:GNAT family N-acetyltransferase [Clostridium sp.]
MIRQAVSSDIPVIEDILLDAVIYLRKAGLENQWNEANIKCECLSKEYRIEDFYIAYDDNKAEGCMALTDFDLKYWPEIEKGQSLYIHKLAVKREYAGRGCSHELISFAKDLALNNGADSLRLDCNYYRKKLREIYENEGFEYVSKKCIGENNYMALYVCELYI